MVRNIFGRIKPSWIDSKPDVVIAFANDHLANGRPRVYLDFLTGMVDRHDGPGEWYKEWIGCRDWSVQGNPVVAEKLLSGMAQRGIRMFGQGENLQFDDNISTPTVWTDLDTLGTTLVPIMHNVTVPPLPGPAECYRVGQAVRQFVEQDLPEDTRVALLATGGMSHEPRQQLDGGHCALGVPHEPGVRVVAVAVGDALGRQLERDCSRPVVRDPLGQSLVGGRAILGAAGCVGALVECPDFPAFLARMNGLPVLINQRGQAAARLALVVVVADAAIIGASASVTAPFLSRPVSVELRPLGRVDVRGAQLGAGRVVELHEAARTST